MLKTILFEPTNLDDGKRIFRREPGMKFHEPYYELLRHTKIYKKWLYVKSYYKSRANPELFQDVKTYCLFIGHARSGHSIIGALLDTHPNVILPDELDALQYVSAGFNRDQLYYLSLERSQAQARRGRRKRGRDGKIYSYHVPDQLQGRFTKIQVIGDSEAGRSVQRFALDPTLLQRLQDTLGDVNIKFIQIIRNPYDNISTMMVRGGRTFESAIHRYFANCEIIADFRKRVNSSAIWMMRQETFLDDPQTHLREICHFLGLEANQNYLDACASILYKSPAKSRSKVAWTPELMNLVQRRIDEFDFLAGYTYES